MAQQKLLAPTTTIWWLDSGQVEDPNEITPELLNTQGVNISCAIVEGYTLNATDPTMDTTRTICDEANVDTPTTKQYEGNISFLRDANLEENESVYNKAFNLFRTAGAAGYLVRRIGQYSDQPADDGHYIQAFGFESDYPSYIEGGENAPPVQFTVPYIPTGRMTKIYALATPPGP